MPFTFRTRPFGWAASAALGSLAAALLLALPIRSLSSSKSVQTISDGPPAFTVTPELANQGRQFFAMSCSQCHGDDAHGDEGPDLHNLGISNARIATTIKNGVKGEMPTFAKKYDDHDVAALVSFLRTLH